MGIPRFHLNLERSMRASKLTFLSPFLRLEGLSMVTFLYVQIPGASSIKYNPVRIGLEQPIVAVITRTRNAFGLLGAFIKSKKNQCSHILGVPSRFLSCCMVIKLTWDTLRYFKFMSHFIYSPLIKYFRLPPCPLVNLVLF